VSFVRNLAVLAIVMTLAACAAPKLPLNDISDIQTPEGISTADPYEQARASGQDIPLKRGTEIIEVRTYEKTPDPKNHSNTVKEISGAKCTVKSDVYSSVVETPGGVRVPLYGIRTPELSVTCKKQKYKDVTTVYRTFNKTEADRYRKYQSAGLIGLLISSAVNAADDDTDDEYNYMMPQIILTPVTDKSETKQVAQSK
jgi:hypothetical protein